jgi:hypothetical protein|tara:strand:- start:552 stop:704 length:153 start_codon:yes stop_codon:yes gene_type:complete
LNRTREFFTFFVAGALFAMAMHMTETTVAYPTMPVELRDACQVADWHPDC